MKRSLKPLKPVIGRQAIERECRRKSAAQYNLGFLYSDKARSLFSTEAGTDLKPYIDASRDAASTFFEVASIAAPVEKADKQTVIPYVQNSLFKAGQIYYSVGIGLKLPEDLVSALQPLTTFVSYVDKGLFPKSDALRKNTETALNYTAASNLNSDGCKSAWTVRCLKKRSATSLPAGDVFRDMVSRYPSANDAAFWQYHVGESYYAAQQFEKAIEEYEKVRTVNKTHKSAAESLYAISTCAQLLSEAAEKSGDEDAKQRWYDQLFERTKFSPLSIRTVSTPLMPLLTSATNTTTQAPKLSWSKRNGSVSIRWR